MAKPDPALLPVFVAGEALTIQRNVNGQNVFMFVEAEDPCSLSERGLILRAKLKQWGASNHADGRVANQYEIITRLSEERKAILDLAIKYGATEIVDLLTREGTDER